jgi:hypothetical protein
MSGFGYSDWSYDPFEKMVIFPPDSLPSRYCTATTTSPTNADALPQAPPSCRRRHQAAKAALPLSCRCQCRSQAAFAAAAALALMHCCRGKAVTTEPPAATTRGSTEASFFLITSHKKNKTPKFHVTCTNDSRENESLFTK